MVKTISEDEHVLLKNFLQGYYNHMVADSGCVRGGTNSGFLTTGRFLYVSHTKSCWDPFR